MVSDCCWMVNNCSLMKSMTKDGDPTGIPRRRNPSVNSTGVGSEGFSLLDLVEKVAIALVMSVARPGLVFVILGIGDVPLVEVNILVLSGLIKQPRDMPRSLNCWQRKRRSSSGTTVDMSSMKPSKFVIPPLPSSWVIPLARRSAAR